MKMSKKLKKCDWCGKMKNNVNHSYYAMSPIIPKYEEKITKAIEKYGPEWWTGLEKDDEGLAEKLMNYDQLTCTVGRGNVCWDCEVKDNQNYEKYRPIVKDEEEDPYGMLKIIAEEEINDIEGMNDWYMDVKERQKKSMKPINLKKDNDE